MKEVYKNTLLKLLPRYLSLLNRNPVLTESGCFDRDYWYYKTLTDTPSAAFQQGILALSLIYKNDFEGNIYFHNDVLLSWIFSGIDYWIKIQNKDGSFNEWYQNEHSFCVTAFTVFAISESFLVLNDLIPEQKRKEILKSICKSGRWLLKHDNYEISNQTAAAINALYNIFLITNDPLFFDGFNKKKERLISLQKDEGWFPEYRGCDLGYSFVTLDLLSHLNHKIKNDDKLLNSLKKLTGFIAYFIHPDSTTGGVYCSRNTTHILPYGLELIKENNKEARVVLTDFLDSINNGLKPMPFNIDDRYFSYFYLNSWTLAAFVPVQQPEQVSEEKNNFIKVFEESGLAVIKKDQYYSVVGMNKGGSYKLYDEKKILCENAGYFIKLKNNKIMICENFMERKYSHVADNNDLNISVTSDFIFLKDTIPLKNFSIPFKLFTGIFLKFNFIAQFFSRYVKTIKILKQSNAPAELKRKFQFCEKEIIISDVIRLTEGNISVEDIEIQKMPVSGYCPSALFFDPSELLNKNLIFDKKMIIDRLNINRKVTIKTIWSFRNKETFYGHIEIKKEDDYESSDSRSSK